MKTNFNTNTSNIDLEKKDFFSSCVIIPALNPSTSLLTLIESLFQKGIKHIIIVDDGSTVDFQTTFRSAADLGAIIIHHATNMGKGEALKTAFRYAINFKFEAVVTVDADGQHSAADAARVLRRVLSEKLPVCVLGVRNFNGEVPLRSKFGNVLTRNVVRAFSSLRVSDTQTGLRGFSAQLLPGLCEVTGHRYEFEMQMLLHIAKAKLKLIEIPIETIYIDNNSDSHFNPVLDSLRIYWVLLRDIFISLSSFGIDIAVFTLFNALIDDILLSTYAARLISSSFNFAGNRVFVFKTIGNYKMGRELFQYIILAIILATVSGGLVQGLYETTNWNVTLCKIFVDFTLYSASFLIRKYYIFKD